MILPSATWRLLHLKLLIAVDISIITLLQVHVPHFQLLKYWEKQTP
jgi:hypothetical protein